MKPGQNRALEEEEERLHQTLHLMILNDINNAIRDNPEFAPLKTLELGNGFTSARTS